jgi:hypothetical protein
MVNVERKLLFQRSKHNIMLRSMQAFSCITPLQPPISVSFMPKIIWDSKKKAGISFEIRLLENTSYLDY